MSKEAVFMIKPAPELLDDTLADAEETRAQYHAFLQRKVDAARASILAGEGIPNDVVEAKFAALRAAARGRQ
ncbi:antitoxin of toxin-antitoxin stability system [Stenotrophomonas sp. PS02289]|uniref:antitoxin of toxin-antitoxin stability system n=1 Tax=Stenotrophomonas sp. PS02289 TaxID=2991422 RepID=UPI002499E317|nr:antitoxin of toxin-antitoxin stability system [Stenotrophomonas sp. PS02289]